MKTDGDVRFPGCKLVEYRTVSGKPRIVAECIMPGVEGLQHIYRPDQFRPMTDAERRKIERMREIWAEGDTPEPSSDRDGYRKRLLKRQKARAWGALAAVCAVIAVLSIVGLVWVAS
jgi:hypothetical protein